MKWNRKERELTLRWPSLIQSNTSLEYSAKSSGVLMNAPRVGRVILRLLGESLRTENSAGAPCLLVHFFLVYHEVRQRSGKHSQTPSVWDHRQGSKDRERRRDRMRRKRVEGETYRGIPIHYQSPLWSNHFKVLIECIFPHTIIYSMNTLSIG